MSKEKKKKQGESSFANEIFYRIKTHERIKSSIAMHELFASVLAKRDLSRAGELFSINDDAIVDDLTEVVSVESLQSAHIV